MPDEKYLDYLALLIAEIIPKFLAHTNYEKYFEFWESRGFHITPNEYDQPIPDTRTLKDEIWQKESELIGVEMNTEHQLKLLRDIFPEFKREYDRIPFDRPRNAWAFHFDNPFFSGTDALVAYCMVRHFQPRTILEVDSLLAYWRRLR